MRPATEADVPAYAALIRDRAVWMVRRGLEGGEELPKRADQIAAQAADNHTPVWAMTNPDGRLVGCTSLYEETPLWGWTDAERAESAVFLATTFTDPAARAERPGALIAWWALGHAARRDKEWVRRGCGHTGLVRYYRDVQGFGLVHTTERHGHPAYLLARKAEELSGLPIRTAANFP
ncbi:GNAT family N-acetyltransferase [Streptomyces sp. 8N616]|uniref:GNAT family N-acetyltransferase n=1 Tax=Streptomyces sp. 8N616 TaxID=3457414 RepID=UPI003FD4524D